MERSAESTEQRGDQKKHVDAFARSQQLEKVPLYAYHKGRPPRCSLAFWQLPRVHFVAELRPGRAKHVVFVIKVPMTMQHFRHQ